MGAPSVCPCGSGASYSQCCEPFHLGAKKAPTAEKLMRSRYCAFALGLEQYLLDTWHPATRPDSLGLDDSLTWIRLIVNETEKGLLFDTEGIVEFTAVYEVTDPSTGKKVRGRQHERSTFSRIDGAWFYVDGEF